MPIPQSGRNLHRLWIWLERPSKIHKYLNVLTFWSKLYKTLSKIQQKLWICCWKQVSTTTLMLLLFPWSFLSLTIPWEEEILTWRQELVRLWAALLSLSLIHMIFFRIWKSYLRGWRYLCVILFLRSEGLPQWLLARYQQKLELNRLRNTSNLLMISSNRQLPILSRDRGQLRLMLKLFVVKLRNILKSHCTDCSRN